MTPPTPTRRAFRRWSRETTARQPGAPAAGAAAATVAAATAAAARATAGAAAAQITAAAPAEAEGAAAESSGRAWGRTHASTLDRSARRRAARGAIEYRIIIVVSIANILK